MDEPSHVDKPPQQTPANEPAGSAAGREPDGSEKVSHERSPLAVWVRQSPPWLVSMIVHAMILIALALLALPVEVQYQFFELITLQPSDVDEEIDDMLDDELEINVESDVQVASDVAEPVEAITDQDFDIESEVSEVATAADDLALAASPLTFDFFADTSAATADVTSVIGGKALTGLGGRSNKGRQALVRKGGGTRGSENAVEAALRWLAAHQNTDGSWSFKHQHSGNCNGRCSGPGSTTSFNGATGFALLPFLGAGYTHQEGKYQETVKRGLQFLVGNMKVDAKGGSLKDGGNMYAHGVATIALSEAYGMTGDPPLNQPAQYALNYIINNQGPTGGWGYGGPGNDTSVAGWQAIALKSGDMAYLRVPPKTVLGIRRFLDGVQAEGGAHYGYSSPAKGRIATTAIGLLCRMYTGWPNAHPSLTRGVQFVSRTGPSKSNMYYNYYATQVMFQYTSGEGPIWYKWNNVMRDYLVQTQDRLGHEAGSWKLGAYHGQGGRVYSTAMAAMVLEIYYRHMPIYRRNATGDFNRLGNDDFPIE